MLLELVNIRAELGTSAPTHLELTKVVKRRTKLNQTCRENMRTNANTLGQE